MIIRSNFRRLIAIPAVFLVSIAGTAHAQKPAPVVGTHLTDAQDVQVIASAINKILPTSPVIVRGRRICRADLVDPQCPKVTADIENGPRMSNSTLYNIAQVLGRPETTLDNLQVLVQPPLVVNDSIYMRIVVVEKRKTKTGYEFVYRMSDGQPKFVRYEPIKK